MLSKFCRFSSPKFLSKACELPRLRATATMTTMRNSSSVKFEERKADVNGVSINYLKTGSGEHRVLLLPGTMGTIWTDFKPQIEHLDKTKMTIVAWDPPGYGKSRPPNRTFTKDFYKRDAQLAHDLMKMLGFEKFSLIGWSSGGITSFILAANNPKSVRKIVAFGAPSYLLPSEMKMFDSIRNIDTWSDRMKTPLMAIYGDEYLRNTWSAWITAMNDILETENGNICKDCIPRIQCPTLIIHGAKDPVIDREHVEYLTKNIRDSRFEIFEDGAHNLHLQYHEEFNDLVTKFLLE